MGVSSLTRGGVLSSIQTRKENGPETARDLVSKTTSYAPADGLFAATTGRRSPYEFAAIGIDVDRQRGNAGEPVLVTGVDEAGRDADAARLAG